MDTPTVEHHNIYDDDSKLRIRLQLKGIFLYFNMRKLTIKEMENWEEHEVIFLTPDSAKKEPTLSALRKRKQQCLIQMGILLLTRAETSSPK